MNFAINHIIDTLPSIISASVFVVFVLSMASAWLREKGHRGWK